MFVSFHCYFLAVLHERVVCQEELFNIINTELCVFSELEAVDLTPLSVILCNSVRLLD